MVAVLVVVVNRDYEDYDDYHNDFLEQLVVVVVVSIVMMKTIVTVAADDVDDDYNDNDKGGISVWSEMAVTDGKLIIAVVGGCDGSCCKSMAKINTISCVGQSNGAHLKSTHPLEMFSIHV
ncbi:hypothetical protein DPMN_152964 [Dreissena polymorpha]|uniref:Uncharacterized protein n=1 Tax=Dreissena polymorpha TaxID=45954 RepID=A0A9D4J8W1_DREPO|nr:hypothetical protein DPMN_152964 [Dreissena polymorpha]